MKRTLSLFMILFSLMLFVGCGSQNSSTNNTSQTNSEVPSSSTQDSNKNKAYKLGEVIRFEGEEILVKEVQRNYSTGNEYQKPKSGCEFVKITISIKNISKDNISINPYEFKLQNSNGVLDDYSSATYNLDDALNSVELVPNGNITGSLLFEAPKDDSDLKLVYSPSFLSNKNLTINL